MSDVIYIASGVGSRSSSPSAQVPSAQVRARTRPVPRPSFLAPCLMARFTFAPLTLAKVLAMFSLHGSYYLSAIDWSRLSASEESFGLDFVVLFDAFPSSTFLALVLPSLHHVANTYRGRAILY